jgi:hypothetical protein
MSPKDLVYAVGTQSEGYTAFDVVVFHVPVDQDPAHGRQRFQSLNVDRKKTCQRESSHSQHPYLLTE